MKKIILVILVLVLILIVGCSKEKNIEPVTDIIESPDTLEKIETVQGPEFSIFEYINTFTEPYKKPDNEVGILTVNIKYPLIKNASENDAYQKIHDYYEQAYMDMRDYISMEAHPTAKMEMKAAEASKGHFVNHTLNVRNEVTYQDQDKISIFIKGDEITGGTLSKQWLDGKTFDLSTGKMLELHEVLGLELEDAKTYVFSAIQAELNKPVNTAVYQQEALDIYQDAFDFEDFYLKDDHLVLFFQTNVITTEVSDLPTFKLNYPEK